MDLCRILVPYGVIWLLVLTAVVVKYRRRKYPVFLYFANLVVYGMYYFQRCQHISVVIQKDPDYFGDNPRNVPLKFHHTQEQDQLPHETLTTPQPIKYWEEARKKLKHHYIDRHISIPGLPYEQYIEERDEDLEKWEIQELRQGKYTEVWFSGLPGVQKTILNESATNRGLDFPADDEEEGGKYRIIPGDHIAYRYEIVKFIAAGVYGQVLLCHDHAVGNKVALKVMNNHTSIKTRMGLEYYAIRYIKRHVQEDDVPFVVGALDVMSFRNHQVFVYELLGESLYAKYHERMVRGFELKRIAWDILEGLAIANRIELLHNDLKPENILVTGDDYPYVKVIDWGMACYRNYWKSPIKEERIGMKCPRNNVQSRYYRSPEVILGSNYTTQSDMWSFGVTVGELFRGEELIYGENDTDQLAAMMEIIGLPPVYLIKRAWYQDEYFEAVHYKTKNGFQRYPWRKSLKKVLGNTDDQVFLDFMNKTLRWDPEDRMTPQQAMRHPWLQEFAQLRFKKFI